MIPTLPIPGEAPDGSFQAGAIVGEKYVVTRTLGAGATGAVYEVRDQVLPERRLALKILHRPAESDVELELQRDELRSMAQVRHPSIIALYDHGVHDGRLFSVLPLMHGDELEGRVFSRKESHRIGSMLARAVAAMHGVQLTHQDIKPENARLTQFDGVPEQTPILLDLGTAVHIGTPLRGFSPAFLAPEIASALVEGRGTPLADPKADVYSLAATIHTMLEMPTEIDDSELVVYLIKKSEGLVPRFRTRGLRYLDASFDRWMHADPKKRPTAAEFAEELDVLLLPERRRSRALTAFVGIAVLASIVGVAAYQVNEADRLTQEARDHAREVEIARNEAVDRATAVEGQLDSTRNERDSASSRVDSLTEEAARLANEARKERETAETSDARARRLAKTVEQMNSVMAQLRTALEAERAARDRYAQQLRDRETQLSNAEAHNREVSAARDHATSEVTRLTGRVSTLEDALSRNAQQLAEARQHLEDVQASLGGELSSTRQQLEVLKANISELEQRLDACRQASAETPPPAP